MERFKGVTLLAHAEELDRLPGHVPHRKRGTTTRIAIHLGQHHTGQRQCFAERLGGVCRVLARHGIDYEQRFGRIDRGVYSLDLGHHLGINGQTTGSIHQHHVNELELGFTDGRLGDLHRLLADIGREEGHTHFAGQGFELLDRSRTIDVSRNHQHALLLALLEEARQLPHGSGLARPLQAGHQHHGRWSDLKRQVLIGSAHQLFQLCANDLHERLPRSQALRDLGANSALLDPIDELLDHRQCDVGLEQRHPHFTQRVLDVVLGQLRLAGDVAKRL